MWQGSESLVIKGSITCIIDYFLFAVDRLLCGEMQTSAKPQQSQVHMNAVLIQMMYRVKIFDVEVTILVVITNVTFLCILIGSFQ